MDALVTRTEVCQLLGVSAKSLYLWERDGSIPKPRRNRRNWRVYSPRDLAAIRRFIGDEQVEKRDTPSPIKGAQRAVGLSARNQLRGTIVSLKRSGFLCEAVLRLGDGQEITGIITESSATRLGLRKGHEATAVIKATEVMMLR